MANHIKSSLNISGNEKKNIPGEKEKKSNKNSKILRKTQTVFYLKGGKTVLLKKPEEIQEVFHLKDRHT